MEGVQEEPAVRANDDTDQVTPQVASNRVPCAPGAPVKKKSRSSATGKLKPKKLVYSDGAEEQEKKITQQSGERLHFSEVTQQLLETRINTMEGTWVQCDHPGCNKWRYLADVIDPTVLPEKWYCSLNKDPKHNSCEAEEDQPDDDLLETKYFVGSIVWARVNTYPWWPAIIDDDPDLCVYEWRERRNVLPTHYHVAFLDQKVTRAWVRDSNCMAFLLVCNHDGPAGNKVPDHFRKAFDAAVETAELAMKLPLAERIKKYCFLNRYPGTCKNLPQASKGTAYKGTGAKRPMKRSRANQESEKEAPAHSRTKKPKESLKQVRTQEGKPGKENKSSAHTIPVQASQGVKRPRGRPRKNASSEDNQPACPTPKQPRVSSKQGPNSKYGASAQSACKNALSKQAAPLKEAKKLTPASVHMPSAKESQGIQKTFKAKTKKMTTAITSLPPTATRASSSIEYTLQDSDKAAGQMQGGPQTKGNDSVAEMFFSDSDSKYRGKKAPSKLAAPVKQVVRPEARKSTSASKPSIKGAQDVQKKHKMNANKATTTITSLPTTTIMASSNTEDTTQDFVEPVSQMQGDYQSKGDDNVAIASKRSLSPSSADHEGAALSEPTVMTMNSKNSESMSVTPQPPTPAKNERQNLLDAAAVPPKDAPKDNSVERPKHSGMMCMLADNITANQPTDTTSAGAQGVGLVTASDLATYSHSLNGKVDTSTEARNSLSTLLFDDVETQPESFPSMHLLLDFLDTDVTTHYKPKLSSLNKAAQAVCINKANKPLLPCEVMDLKTAPVNLGTAPKKALVEKSMHSDDLQGHGTAVPSATASKKPSAIHYEPKLTGLNRAAEAVCTSKADKPLLPSEVMGLETAPDKVPTEKSMQTAGSRMQVHGATITSVNAPKQPSKVKKPNQVPPGEQLVTDLTGTVSNTCAASVRQTGTSKSKLPKSGNNKEDTVAKKKTSCSLNKQSSKPKKQPASENKENTDRPVKPQATLSTDTTSAKARKTAPKLSQPSSTSTVAPNALKKPSFKVPIKDRSAAKMEAKLQATLANVLSNVANVANASKPADSEDSDFDSLSNTQELTFEDVLSSISQSMSQSHESDFVSLEEVDGSQTFNIAETE